MNGFVADARRQLGKIEEKVTATRGNGQHGESSQQTAAPPYHSRSEREIAMGPSGQRQGLRSLVGPCCSRRSCASERLPALSWRVWIFDWVRANQPVYPRKTGAAPTAIGQEQRAHRRSEMGRPGTIMDNLRGALTLCRSLEQHHHSSLSRQLFGE